MYINTLLTFVISVIMLIWIWPIAGLIIATVGVATFIIIGKYDKVLVRLLEEQNTLSHKVGAYVFDYLSNIKTIITLRFEERVRQVLQEALLSIRPAFRKYTRLNEMKWFTVNMLLAVVTSIVIGVYIYSEYQMNGMVLVGTVTMIFQYIKRMTDSLYNFARQYSDVVQNETNVRTVGHIVETFNEMERRHHIPSFDSRSTITIQHLSFAYQQDAIERSVLTDIGLSFHKGEKIAFV